MINRHKQRGAETVEFAMIALLFFAILFAIIEFSRAMFTWNALAEATRRGARLAAVCPVGSPIPAQVAIFDVIDGSLGTSPIISGLTPNMVSIRYLNEGGNDEADAKNIRFVEASITDYPHQLIIPLWGSLLTAPPFTTTLPSESLGVVPNDPGNDRCNF